MAAAAHGAHASNEVVLERAILIDDGYASWTLQHRQHGVTTTTTAAGAASSSSSSSSSGGFPMDWQQVLFSSGGKHTLLPHASCTFLCLDTQKSYLVDCSSMFGGGLVSRTPLLVVQVRLRMSTTADFDMLGDQPMVALDADADLPPPPPPPHCSATAAAVTSQPTTTTTPLVLPPIYHMIGRAVPRYLLGCEAFECTADAFVMGAPVLRAAVTGAPASFFQREYAHEMRLLAELYTGARKNFDDNHFSPRMCCLLDGLGVVYGDSECPLEFSTLLSLSMAPSCMLLSRYTEPDLVPTLLRRLPTPEANATTFDTIMRHVRTTPWLLYLEGFLDHQGMQQAINDFGIRPRLRELLAQRKLPSTLAWHQAKRFYMLTLKPYCVSINNSSATVPLDAGQAECLTLLAALRVVTVLARDEQQAHVCLPIVQASVEIIAQLIASVWGVTARLAAAAAAAAAAVAAPLLGDKDIFNDTSELRLDSIVPRQQQQQQQSPPTLPADNDDCAQIMQRLADTDLLLVETLVLTRFNMPNALCEMARMAAHVVTDVDVEAPDFDMPRMLQCFVRGMHLAQQGIVLPLVIICGVDNMAPPVLARVIASLLYSYDVHFHAGGDYDTTTAPYVFGRDASSSTATTGERFALTRTSAPFKLMLVYNRLSVHNELVEVLLSARSSSSSSSNGLRLLPSAQCVYRSTPASIRHRVTLFARSDFAEPSLYHLLQDWALVSPDNDTALNQCLWKWLGDQCATAAVDASRIAVPDYHLMVARNDVALQAVCITRVFADDTIQRWNFYTAMRDLGNLCAAEAAAKAVVASTTTTTPDAALSTHHRQHHHHHQQQRTPPPPPPSTDINTYSVLLLPTSSAPDTPPSARYVARMLFMFRGITIGVPMQHEGALCDYFYRAAATAAKQ